MKNLAFVIEDQPDVSVTFLRALVEAGYQPQIIPNGREALSRLEKESPSLVILDVSLPEVDGGKILDFIREHEHLANTKVIMATEDPEDISVVSSHQADLFLQKPITYAQMRDFAQRYKAA